MIYKLMASVLIAGLAYGAGPAAYAAGKYDGTWSGTAPTKGDCGVLNVAMTVKDNKVTGTVKGAKGTASIESGTVASDGSVKIKYQTSGATIKFSADTFTGQFATLCGMRETTGNKVK